MWRISQMLAQTPPASRPFTPADRYHLIIDLAILMALVIAGGFGILLIRRRLHEPDDPTNAGSTGFSLSDLRAMVDRGELTPEEYERTRQRVIAKVKSSAHKPRSGPTGGTGQSPTDLP